MEGITDGMQVLSFRVKDEERPDVVATLDNLFRSTTNRSFLKKYLTQELADKLKERKTSAGGTIADCIISGVELDNSKIGIFASDADAYIAYWDLFRPIIVANHKIADGAMPSHPASDLVGSLWADNIENLDPSGELVLSVRVRLGRNLAGHAFSPFITRQDRCKLEDEMKQIFRTLGGDYGGQYTSLADMSDIERQTLASQHILFTNNDRFLSAGRIYRDWPEGRGVYYNADKSLMIWLNEEDHLRIISMATGGNLRRVYERIVKLHELLANRVRFSHSGSLGYLAVCPSNLGTGLRASVHVRLRRLAKLPHFKQICDLLHLEIRGFHGENTEVEDDIHDVSNKRRFGVTESEAIADVARGVSTLVMLEMDLAKWA